LPDPQHLFNLPPPTPQLGELHDTEQWLKTKKLEEVSAHDMRQLKQRGFSDSQIARAVGSDMMTVRKARKALGVEPSMKRVDTCAAEFEAGTPYMYSAYDGECECDSDNNPKVLILGGGPNRIGQGIEFDYCCCHASFSLRDAGYETIMMNSNPETVSTDYDTSSRLYFEPLTVEDVLNVIEKERPEGIIVQFGGQTPLKLATALQKALEDNPIPAASGNGNVQIWGTQPDAIDEAEDRDRWMELLKRLDIRQPAGGVATNEAQALAIANNLGYPVMVRPSYVLGGRAMEIVYSDADIHRYINTAVEVDPERPVLVDKYLDRADELDVDALADKDGNVVICGIMQHIEQAGVHSGDSACSIPPQTISEECLATIREWTPKLAKALKVVGLINIQYAVQDNTVYIIEANPRASRTVPFVAKAIGHPLAAYASLLMSGKTLAELGFTEEPKLNHVAVKEAVLPFDKFAGADTLLGPEMRSTGEVMGIDVTFGKAYAKAAIAAGQRLPTGGNVFITMMDKYKEAAVPIAKDLQELGFGIMATYNTAAYLRKAGLTNVQTILKVQEGRPNAEDLLKNGDIQMMIITTAGDEADVRDGKDLRRAALAHKVPIITTIAAARATVEALRDMSKGALEQVPLQDYFK
jgi:carbamoyl-phosphate synthase large subunit